MNTKEQKLNLPSIEQEKQYRIEFTKAIQNVKESTDSFINIRYTIWSNIIQFNAIIIGAFSMIISINKNINIFYYFLFYIISFLPILLIMINFYILKNSMYNMLESSVNQMKLKIPEFQRINYILEKNDPNYTKNQTQDKDKKQKPSLIKVSTIEKIAVAFSLITFIYFILAIYINISNNKTEQMIINCFLRSIKFFITKFFN